MVEHTIKAQITMLEYKKADLAERMNESVKHFKEYVAAANDFDIAEFVPGKARDIADLRNRIREVDEQIRMLSFILTKA